jgi:adenine deaminase
LHLFRQEPLTYGAENINLSILHNQIVKISSSCGGAVEMEELLAVARGARPADLVLRNLRVIDVLAEEVYPGDIALCGDRIAGIGPGYRGREEVDLGGRLVCPGLIDAHVHIESSLVRPREYARAAVARGVTTVVANPHEIANVLGREGVRYMARDGERGPLGILLTVPSSVPATPLATSGAALDHLDLEQLREEPGVVGLGEVMDFAGVASGRRQLLEELALFSGHIIDGHCPGLGGHDLNAYAAAGIVSDHECATIGEARAKLRCGMKLFLREGSAARNLRDLLPLLTSANERWLSFCTDDLNPQDLLHQGSIDHLVRMAMAAGVEPITAIRMATLNPAEHFRLGDRGLIAPGRRADLVLLETLQGFSPTHIYQSGKLVSRMGKLPGYHGEVGDFSEPKGLRRTVNLNVGQLDFAVHARGTKVRVIGIVPDQLVTEELILEARTENGLAVAAPERDLLKLAVVERHHGSGRIGVGFVRGMGLRQGAMASTVAHDHHNLIVIGADDQSMLSAASAVIEASGGLAIAVGEQVLELLPLPVAGLMSDRPIEDVAGKSTNLRTLAQQFGSSLADPFMTLSFLGLEVIPALKLTDYGLVDVKRMQLVPLFPED